MAIRVTEDIYSVTDFKRHARDIFAQAHQTRRPVILTRKGRDGVVLIDAKTYENQLRALNLSRLLLSAEREVLAKRTRPIRSFLKKFKNAHKVPR